MESQTETNQGLKLRRMASETYRAVFGETPDSVTISRSTARSNEPGEAVVTLQAASGGTALVFVRAGGLSPDVRWIAAMVVCEALQSGLRPEVATALSVFPLARGALAHGPATEAHAWGSTGQLRFVADRAFVAHAFSAMPQDGESVRLCISVPAGSAQQSGVWATSPCRGRLTATPDEFEVVVESDGTVQLVEARSATTLPDHFEFTACLHSAALDKHRFAIGTLSTGAGQGAWLGWRARLAAGNGVVAVEILAPLSDDDATEELNRTLPPERAK